MKTLADRDLGINCDYVARADTEEEVTCIATDHIQDQHPYDYDWVKDMMADKIKTE